MKVPLLVTSLFSLLFVLVGCGGGGATSGPGEGYNPQFEFDLSKYRFGVFVPKEPRGVSCTVGGVPVTFKNEITLSFFGDFGETQGTICENNSRTKIGLDEFYFTPSFYNPLDEAVTWNGRVFVRSPEVREYFPDLHGISRICTTDANEFTQRHLYLYEDAGRGVILLQFLTGRGAGWEAAKQVGTKVSSETFEISFSSTFQATVHEKGIPYSVKCSGRNPPQIVIGR